MGTARQRQATGGVLHFRGGAELTSTGNIDQGHHRLLPSQQKDCSTSSLKPRCTTAAVRKVTRDVNEDVRDRVRALANTETFR